MVPALVMKTTVYSGPGPTFKGIVRVPTGVVFETDWLPSKEEVIDMCDGFKALHNNEPAIDVSADQAAREARWDF
jgi:hypothetical protein